MKESLMRQAISDIRDNNCSCVVCANDKILFAEKGMGIRPLLSIYLDNKDQMKDTYAFDKVVGTAAATLLADAGISLVYGQTMSVGAKQILEQNGIEVVAEKLVPVILNRTKDDLCPLEKRMLDVADGKDRIKSIIAFSEEMSKKNQG